MSGELLEEWEAAERRKETGMVGRERGNNERAGGLGKTQKEGQRCDRTEEHQEVVGGEEDWQTCESEQHPGEPVKNPPRNCATVSASQTATIDMMSGGVTTSCATESKCLPSQTAAVADAGW